MSNTEKIFSQIAEYQITYFQFQYFKYLLLNGIRRKTFAKCQSLLQYHFITLVLDNNLLETSLLTYEYEFQMNIQVFKRLDISELKAMFIMGSISILETVFFFINMIKLIVYLMKLLCSFGQMYVAANIPCLCIQYSACG